MSLRWAPLFLIGAISAVFAASGCSQTSPISSAPLNRPTATPTATPTAAPTTAPSPQAVTWNVLAGSSEMEEAFQALRFYPTTITIDAGDSVTWTFPSLEPHTVAFPVPGTTPQPASASTVSDPAGGTTEDGSTYVSSGFIAGGGTYTLKFPKAGTYTYYSLIHQPEAVGTIVVQAAGTAYPMTAAQYASTGASELAADYAEDTSALAQFPFTANGPQVAAGIAYGLSTAAPANASVMRFLSDAQGDASNITVPLGTTVTWTNESNNVPHDIVFPAVGGTIPSTLGPFDPASGGNTYDGSTLTDSGVVGPGGTYSLTFMARGTFTYECLFHSQEHMDGSVTVQ